MGSTASAFMLLVFKDQEFAILAPELRRKDRGVLRRSGASLKGALARVSTIVK